MKKTVALTVLLTAVATLIASCDQSPVENKRSRAELACITRSLAARGYATIDANSELAEVGNSGEAVLEESAPATTDQFRILSSGQFVADFGLVKLAKPYQPYTLRCTGDFNAGTVTSVQVDGVLRRPAEGERWTF